MSFTMFNLFQILSVVVLIFGATEAVPLFSGQRHGHKHLHKRNGLGSVVTNGCANWNNKNTNDGPQATNPQYQSMHGSVANFPSRSQWVSFDSMWEANQPILSNGCAAVEDGTPQENSPLEIELIRNYTLMVARNSHVDHRAILAVILQESNGCVRVRTTYNPIANPGLMQSHNGASYNPAAPATSIHQMITDGTQGTADGDGLVQLLNRYGDYYSAFRGYNSGTVDPSELSKSFGSTSCYVSDIANRLIGWVGSGSGNCAPVV